MNAFLAGAVPIFAGGTLNEADEDLVLNPKALIYMHEDEERHGFKFQEAIDRVRSALRDPAVYEGMAQQPPFSKKGVQLLTWHSAMWPEHGRHMQEQIIE